MSRFGVLTFNPGLSAWTQQIEREKRRTSRAAAAAKRTATTTLPPIAAAIEHSVVSAALSQPRMPSCRPVSLSGSFFPPVNRILRPAREPVRSLPSLSHALLNPDSDSSSLASNQNFRLCFSDITRYPEQMKKSFPTWE